MSGAVDPTNINGHNDIFESPEKRLEYYVPLIEESLAKLNVILDDTDYYGKLARGERVSSLVSDARSDLYDLGIKMAGEARQGDLVAMREFIKPKQGEVAVDIAAGTGFLTKAVSEWTGSITYGVDPNQAHLEHIKKNCSSLVVPVYGWPDDHEKLFVEGFIPEDGVDFVTSFGGIHHIDNGSYEPAFQNITFMLKPGGRFCAADVPAGSDLERYFDEIVDQKCLTKHLRGNFMSPKILSKYSEQAGLTLVSAEIKPLTWDFHSEKEMAWFFKCLYAYDLPEEEIVGDLQKTLGYKNEDGMTKLNWPMLFFEIRK